MRAGSRASEETRNRMTEAHKRRWRAKREAYLASLYFTHLGRKRPEETKEKMSESHKRLYRENPELREETSVRAQQHWARPGARKRVAISKGTVLVDDRGRIYYGYGDAAEKLGVSYTTIARTVNAPTKAGVKRTCRGRALTRI